MKPGKLLPWVLLAVAVAGACQTTAPTTAPSEEPAGPTATTAPTDAPPPTDTEVPEPTSTPIPPSATPTEVPPTPTETVVPDPIVIGAAVGEDGCTPVELNPEAWSSLYIAYNGGSDPFFHIHTDEESFFVGIELYTVYGAGWTGQTGTFALDCSANGICVYLVPDAVHPYLATEGEVEIESLSQTGGLVDFPVQLTLRDLVFEPAPGSASTGCYTVEQFEIEAEG